MSDTVATAMRRAFPESCAKNVAREVGCKPETAKNWRVSRARPSDKFYIKLLRLLYARLSLSIECDRAILRGLADELLKVEEGLAFLADRRATEIDPRQGVLPGIFAASVGDD